MEVTTIQKYIHTSPRKLRLVADSIRKMNPAQALDILRVTQKAAARDLVKAMETVMANMRQAGMDQDRVGFKKIEINESVASRRFRAGTRGRVKPYKKKMSHIKIVLSDELKMESKKQIKNEEPKTEEPAKEAK